MSATGDASGRAATGAPAQSPATQPVRRGRTPSANVERELLAAAETVLVRDGPGGLTVRAVAAEAGIAPMGVYNKLGGKDGLIDALLIRGFDRLRTSLEAALADTAEPMGARFVTCGWIYRQFALDNPHFYAIMFEGPLLHEHDNPDVEEHAKAAFGSLVRIVEMGTAAGVIAVPDPFEAAQQIWSSLHGAVALELKGLILTPDPKYTYQALLTTIVRGLAPR